MATGDVSDMAGRIRRLLPARWFPEPGSASVLDALLTGIGTGWSFCYDLLSFARAQARLATATGPFLEMIATDFFGPDAPRLNLERDDHYRARLASLLLRERATRPALVSILTAMTGHAPWIFEPSRPADTGGYGSSANPGQGGGGGYGTQGIGYGTLAMPFACFVVVHRDAAIDAIAAVGPYASGPAPATGSTPVISVGGYGSGALEYLALDSVRADVTDADILDAIASTLPVGVIAWTRLA